MEVSDMKHSHNTVRPALRESSLHALFACKPTKGCTHECQCCKAVTVNRKDDTHGPYARAGGLPSIQQRCRTANEAGVGRYGVPRAGHTRTARGRDPLSCDERAGQSTRAEECARAR